MIRKALEAFLGQHSQGGNLYKKMITNGFDSSKKTGLLKFANDMSHSTFSGIDPALVSESKRGISNLLEIVEQVAPVPHNASINKIAN